MGIEIHQRRENNESKRTIGYRRTYESTNVLDQKREQRYKNDNKFKSDTENLNLKDNTEGIYKCQGRTPAHYPV